MCLRCPLSCEKCTTDGKTCLTCPSYRTAVSNSDYGVTCSCVEGYFDDADNDKCLKCNVLCKYCSTVYNHCTFCYDGYNLTDAYTCEQCSDQNCKVCDVSLDKCSECNDGYNITSGTCVLIKSEEDENSDDDDDDENDTSDNSTDTDTDETGTLYTYIYFIRIFYFK